MKHSVFRAKFNSLLANPNALFYAIVGLIILLYFIINRTFLSGFHFADDWELILFESESLNSTQYLDLLKHYVKRDLDWRFRPFYYAHQIAMVYTLGLNFAVLSVYKITLFCLSIKFFFTFLKNLNFQFKECILFVLLIFIGPQMSIWWRLGPNESIAILLLSISFYSITSKKISFGVNNYLFISSLSLAALSKESFTIIIPAVVLLKIYIDSLTFKISFGKSLRKNHLAVLPLIVMLINLYIIIAIVGINNSSYCGVDLYSLKAMILGVRDIILFNIYYFILLIGVLSTAFYFVIKDEKEFIARMKILSIPFIFCLLVVVPNVVLHAKSGMSGRFMLPSTIGFSFLIVSFIHYLKKNENWFKIFAIFITLFLLIPPATHGLMHSYSFGKEGRSLKVLFNEIKKSDNSEVWLVADPIHNIEYFSSLDTYLTFYQNKTVIPIAGLINGQFNSEKYSLNNQENDDLHTWYENNEKYKANQDSNPPQTILFLDSTQIKPFFKKFELKGDYAHNTNVKGVYLYELE